MSISADRCGVSGWTLGPATTAQLWYITISCMYVRLHAGKCACGPALRNSVTQVTGKYTARTINKPRSTVQVMIASVLIGCLVWTRWRSQLSSSLLSQFGKMWTLLLNRRLVVLLSLVNNLPLVLMRLTFRWWQSTSCVDAQYISMMTIHLFCWCAINFNDDSPPLLLMHHTFQWWQRHLFCWCAMHFLCVLLITGLDIG